MKTKTYKPNKQQAKFMLAAGFKQDSSHPSSDIIRWRRGDILLVFGYKDRVDITKFTDKVISQSVYRAEQAFSLRMTNAFYYNDDPSNLFKTKN